MVVHSMATDYANDLTFRLQRSIQLVKEQKMAKRNGKKGSKERAATSRERRLALALRAVLDEVAKSDDAWLRDAVVTDAMTTLDGLGYGSLVGIPKRVAALNEQLTAAVAAGDGKEISRLGLELERAKAGKPPLSVAPAAAKKSSRNDTVANTEAVAAGD
jgi:hypothetical protein